MARNIKGNAMLREFIDYLEQQVAEGAIYVWGAQGQFVTGETQIKSMENSTTNANRAIALWKKRLAAGFKNIRMYDCSGLCMYWLQNIKKIYSTDKSANSLYGACEKITKANLKKGDWVFRGTVLRKTHIGYVVDDALNVIESKGRDDGVVKRSLNASGSTYWSYFGRPKVFKAEIESGIVNEGDIMIKRGDKGNVVKAWQSALIKVGFSLPKYGIDGDFGAETETATKAFQSKNGLTQSGVVDAGTAAAMFSALLGTGEAEKIALLEAKIEAVKKVIA